MQNNKIKDVKNFIDNYKKNAFVNGGSFPSGKSIPNGYHSETIINEIVKEFNMHYSLAKHVVLNHLQNK